MYLFANHVLKVDGLDYLSLDENTNEAREMLEAVKEEALDSLGYFLKPKELFHKSHRKAMRTAKPDKAALSWMNCRGFSPISNRAPWEPKARMTSTSCLRTLT